MKRFFESSVGSSISVYVVMQGSDHIGTIRARWTPTGTCIAEAAGWGATCVQGSELITGNASGGGYDKLASILSGNRWLGVMLSESWEKDLRDAGYTVICAA